MPTCLIWNGFGLKTQEILNKVSQKKTLGIKNSLGQNIFILVSSETKNFEMDRSISWGFTGIRQVEKIYYLQYFCKIVNAYLLS